MARENAYFRNPNTATQVTGHTLSSKNQVIEKLYEHGEFNNWSPVYLVADLGVVKTDLKKKPMPWLYSNVSDPTIARLFRKDTLYVLDMGFRNYNKFNGHESKNTSINFAHFGAPYKLCSAEIFL